MPNGFGKPTEEPSPNYKQFVDANFKQCVDANLNGYQWLKDQVSDDKEVSQKLAKFVMRCLSFVKDRAPVRSIPRKKLDLLNIQFARMLTYAYYTQMAIALAEFEPTGAEGMTVAKTVGVLYQSTDDQLSALEETFA